MFTITSTILPADESGKGTRVLAMGHKRQRTLPYDHSVSHEANLGSAVGAVLNVLTTPVQQAKIKHPSGGQRVKVEHIAYQTNRWTIEV